MCAWTSVISWGKDNSHHPSTISFSENVTVENSSYRDVCPFTVVRLGQGLTAFNKNSRANFGPEDIQRRFQGDLIIIIIIIQ